jgi:hypothetical protein
MRKRETMKMAMSVTFRNGELDPLLSRESFILIGIRYSEDYI